MKHGLLLINLGTPKQAETSAVRSYLSSFLTDKRVIDLPAALRYVLVYAFILPFRSKRSAHAYRTIWTTEGSPLLFHSKNLLAKMQQTAGATHHIRLGMRYGDPSISQALTDLKDCDSITILPLYPQYSSAATGSSIEEAMRIISTWEVIPSIRIIRDFFQHPAYIQAQAENIKMCLDDKSYLLFSYHGIPERQIVKGSCRTVCQEICPSPGQHSQGCYKAQCHQTSRLLARALHLPDNRHSTAFQSRLGKTPWIKPYTDEVLTKLAHEGIENLVITCPSFVADCLETLEEIGIRAREQWLALGGKKFTMVPCLNDSPRWINAVNDIASLSGQNYQTT